VACDGYFPVIYIRGTGLTTTLTGTKGQGIMIIDGNVKLAGNFEFYGPIIVKGSVETLGVGNKVTGGIMAANTGCTSSPCNNISGSVSLAYSSCAISMALASRPVYPVVAKRAWADLF
jgi:hypothetical protein